RRAVRVMPLLANLLTTRYLLSDDLATSSDVVPAKLVPAKAGSGDPSCCTTWPLEYWVPACAGTTALSVERRSRATSAFVPAKARAHGCERCVVPVARILLRMTPRFIRLSTCCAVRALLRGRGAKMPTLPMIEYEKRAHPELDSEGAQKSR